MDGLSLIIGYCKGLKRELQALQRQALQRAEVHMPVKVFQVSKYKEEIKEKLRQGISPEEIAKQYPISVRSAYNYLKEVRDEKEGKSPPPKKNTVTPNSNIAPGVSKEAFTPSGSITAPPAGSPPGTEYLNLGTFRFPLEDWGYSSTLNLLIVAETFTQARQEYKFPPTVKVGDFLAQLCQAFRIMRGWDVVGAGYLADKYIKEENDNGGSGGANVGAEVSEGRRGRPA
jgi:hypothetical protein